MIEPPATTSGQGTAQRVGSALGRRSNWEQLAKFCVVGASGYVVNLAVYVVLFKYARTPLPAGCRRLIPRRGREQLHAEPALDVQGAPGHVAYQGPRFLVVSTLALGANLCVLYVLVRIGVGAIPAQAAAIVLVTPLNFIGNKLWSFRR